DRSLDRRTGRARRGAAPTAGRLPAAGSDRAAHASLIHKDACREASFALPAAGCGGGPGRSGGAGKDSDRAGGLSHESRSQRGADADCLDQSAPQNSCRPAVDALFTSISEVYGNGAIAVILTGMGQDGLRGAQILKTQGSRILAQDEASSVVWGMPGAVAREGVADRVLPLDQVAPEIVRLAAQR